MKILVHYGYGKTGTTSLQYSLVKNRKRLMKHGVLYPRMFRTEQEHHLLQGLFKSEEYIAPFLIQNFDGYENLKVQASVTWNRIKREVAQTQPEVLLLSSELFIGEDPGGDQEKFFDLLSDLSDDIQPILYVRDPAGLYLSRLQQMTRNSGAVRPPSAENIRGQIEHLEKVYGRKLLIRAFQRGTLVDGDIVKDFSTNFLKEYIDPSLMGTIRANESMSAEAMEISSSFRRIIWPDQDLLFFKKSHQLLSKIENFEAKMGTTNKPVLREGIADQIRRASIDYVWLRDEYGITFESLDYDEIDGTPVPQSKNYKTVSGIIDIDWNRYSQIVFNTLSREMDSVEESSLKLGRYTFKLSNVSRKIERVKKFASKTFAG